MSLMRCLPLAHNLGIARFSLSISHHVSLIVVVLVVYTYVARRILRMPHDQSYLPLSALLLLVAGAAFSPQHPDLIVL